MWNSDTDRDVELRAIVGALVLGADHPLTAAEIHKIVEDVELARRAQAADAPEVTDAELVAAQAEEDVAAGRTTAYGSPRSLANPWSHVSASAFVVW